MFRFCRMLLGLALLPACWAVLRATMDGFRLAAGADGWLSVGTLAFAGGMTVFFLSWSALARSARVYVLGHELTHALWGLFFGALPSRLRIGDSGGSVSLTKSNVFITLAPYFFPFYTFVVLVVALVTRAVFGTLYALPLWLFLIGFTWAFHCVFTVQTLSQRQPDVQKYGRLFSWTFILLANAVLVLAWLAATTGVTFAQIGARLCVRLSDAYFGTFAALADGARWIVRLVAEGGGRAS